MRWPLSESVLKGVFLGLLVYAGLAVPPATAACGLAAGLAVGLLVAIAQKLKRGFRPAGRPIAFLLFVLLESPAVIYGGTVLGLAVVTLVLPTDEYRGLLLYSLTGGAALGIGLAFFRGVRPARIRMGGALAAWALAVGTIVGAFLFNPELLPEARQHALGSVLLIGLPFFYLLTFVGEVEEYEGDVAVWCGILSVGLWLVRPQPASPFLGLFAFFAYTWLVLPRLRVFKHTLRGLSYARLGHHRPALTALRRATRLDPANRRAREALWEVHRDLDAAKIAADPELVGLIDPYFCLDRAAALLLSDRPTEIQRAEATHLLDLVADQVPALLPQVTYWRAVADTHAGRLDEAAAGLSRLLDPTAWPAGDPARQAVLVPAWQLALTLHPELNRRVGTVEVAKPGRRLEAIAAVERLLAQTPEDAEAWKLKRLLYHDVTEAEYDAGPVAEVRSSVRRTTRVGIARRPEPLAAGGRVPANRGPRPAAKRAVDVHENWRNLTNDAAMPTRPGRRWKPASRPGLAVGPKSLPEAERHAFFALVRRLAEDAHARDDFRAAVENYQLYTRLRPRRAGNLSHPGRAVRTTRRRPRRPASHRAGTRLQRQGSRPARPPGPLLLLGHAGPTSHRPGAVPEGRRRSLLPDQGPAGPRPPRRRFRIARLGAAPDRAGFGGAAGKPRHPGHAGPGEAAARRTGRGRRHPRSGSNAEAGEVRQRRRSGSLVHRQPAARRFVFARTGPARPGGRVLHGVPRQLQAAGRTRSTSSAKPTSNSANPGGRRSFTSR